MKHVFTKLVNLNVVNSSMNVKFNMIYQNKINITTYKKKKKQEVDLKHVYTQIGL